MRWLPLVLLIFVPEVWAVCGGSSPTWTAADATKAEVDLCVSGATTGDTILVPANQTQTWGSAVVLPSDKDLTIKGFGGSDAMTVAGTPGASDFTLTYKANGTVITCTADCFQMNNAATHRVSGFHLKRADDNSPHFSFTGEAASGKYLTIDNNFVEGTTSGGWVISRFAGGSNGVAPTSLVYRNRMAFSSFHMVGTLDQMDDGDGQTQHEIWAKEPNYGNAHANAEEQMVFEDNYITDLFNNANDGNYSCRKVIRFNTVVEAPDGTRWVFEIHGMQGDNRGCQQTEVYNNYYTNGAATAFSEMRGGSGVYFDNECASSGCIINLTIDRSEYDEEAGFGWPNECCRTAETPGCTHTGESPSGVDEAVTNENGWVCRDQVGLSHDNTQWSHGTTIANPTVIGAWDQVKRSLYEWNQTNIQLTVNTQGDIEDKIVVDREFHCDDTYDGVSAGSSCNSGVQTGTSLPGTCTVGEAYWKTDEADWNNNVAGNDGQLYRCATTNNWSLYYTPRTYPDPRREDAAGDTPDPSLASKLPTAKAGTRWTGFFFIALLLGVIYAYRIKGRRNSYSYRHRVEAV